MKKNRRNIWFGIILCLFIFANISIIVRKNRELADKVVVSSEKKIEITVWTKDRHDMEFWMEKIEDYNNRNTDGILVRYQVFVDNYEQAVRNVMNTQNEPDLLSYTQQVFIPMKNCYADIMPFMDDEFKQTFAEAIIENYNVKDGKCFYVPTAATSCRLFYNKTIFQKAGITEIPETMEEVIEAAKIITDKLSSEGIYGFAINLKSAESALNRSLLKQGNIQLGLKAGYDFKKGEYDFLQYESLIEKWRILLSKECAYPDCGNLMIDPLRKLFAEGKIGMYISYSHSELGAYMNQYTMENEWGCTQLPTEFGRVVGAQNYNLNNGYLFNKNSAHLEEAWKVYCAIFANTEYLKEYYKEGLGISIISKFAEQAQENEILRNNSQLYIGNNEKIWPLTPLELQENRIDMDGLNQYEVFKNLILGEEDIRTELVELSMRYNRAYQEAVKEGRANKVCIENFDPMNPLTIIAGENIP